MGNATVFPSRGWFEALARRMEVDYASYRELGSIDCAMVCTIKVLASPGTPTIRQWPRAKIAVSKSSIICS